MKLNELQTELRRLQQVADRWQAPHDITPIERDLIMGRLRTIYEALLFGLEEAAEEVVAPVVAESMVASVAEPSMADEKSELAETPFEEAIEEDVCQEQTMVDEVAVSDDELRIAPVAAEELTIEREPTWSLDADELLALDAEFEEERIEEPIVEAEETVEEELLLDPLPEVVVDLSDLPHAEPTVEAQPLTIDEITDEAIDEAIAEGVAAVAAEVAAEGSDAANYLEENPSEPVVFIEEEEPIVSSIEEQPSVEEAHEVEPAVEPILTSAPESMPEAATEPVTPPAERVATTLFGEEDATVVHRRKQRTILSLYEQQPIKKALPKDSPVDEVVCDPEVIEISDVELARPKRNLNVVRPAQQPTPVAPTQGKPRVEQPAAEKVVAPAVADTVQTQPVLGEVIKPVETLADRFTPQPDVAEELRRRTAVTDLRRAVDVNDKYRLIRDLFGGNGALYEITIRRLNEFQTMEDCLLYIADHFHWNPDSDGARLLMEALERKFAQ